MKSNLLAKRKRAVKIVKLLEKATHGMIEPASSSIVREFGKKPYLVLVGCMLSPRTKDSVSLPASRRLFLYAKTPQKMVKLSLATIQKLIYPVSFYRNKAKAIHKMSALLLEKFNGKVPKTEQGLLSLPGVGRKTMSLVLADGFRIPAICVDTHVHKISNRLGLVSTKTVGETEEQLKQVLPKKYWSDWNRLLVMWGQNICVPVSPKCSQCILLPICPQKGVTRHR